MSFDGTFTHAMVAELQHNLIGGRISKIQQPFKNELVLTVRSNRTNYPLLLSANPLYSRIQTTNIRFANPDKPANFVMSLRKKIDGAIINEIKQINNDRIVVLTLETKDELGYSISFKLIMEIMGRYSNVVLVDQNNLIVDLIKHVPSSLNRYRILMPGQEYVFPPTTGKKNPFADFSDTDLQDIRGNFEGIDKDTENELNYRLEHSEIQRVAFREFFKEIDQKPYPNIAKNDQKQKFYPIKYLSASGDTDYYPSLSEMLDKFYQDRAQTDRVKSNGQNLLAVVNGVLKKDHAKIKHLKKDLAKTEKMDQYRLYGELLTTFMHEVKPNATKVELTNYYDNEQIEIPLDVRLTASENAQKYFKTYQKLKKSIVHIDEQLTQTQEEIDYLESVLYQIGESQLDNLLEIKDELIAGGYLSKKSQTKKKKQSTKEIGNKYLSSTGDLITVGQNNVQNDQLSLKIAKKDFIWLHVKNIPGSHVIISNNNPDEVTLLEAANIAAFYSKAKNSSNVSVDYVPVKKLKKPNGAKPGFVIYEGQKTLVVTPDSQLVEQLKQNYLDSKDK